MKMFNENIYSTLRFNFIAKKLYRRLLQLGAQPLVDVGCADEQNALGFVLHFVLSLYHVMITGTFL